MWPSTRTPDLLSAASMSVDVDIAEIGNVREVEADRLAHEQLERHLVDRLAAGLHVVVSIDVRADVVQHAHILDGRGEGIAGHPLIVGLAALVRHPLEIDWARHVLVRRHVVLDGDGQIDDASHVVVFLYLRLSERNRGAQLSRVDPVDARGPLVLLGECCFN